MKQVVVQRGQIRRIGWVIKTLGSQVGQFLVGCKCSLSLGIVIQEQDTVGEIPAPFFLQNDLRLHLWKIIDAEDAFLIPKNQGENFST